MSPKLTKGNYSSYFNQPVSLGSHHLQIDLTGLVAAFAAITLSLAPAQAAQYGGFGSSYSEVINPKDAVLNDETVKSDDVKAGLEKLRAYQAKVAAIKEALVSTV